MKVFVLRETVKVFSGNTRMFYEEDIPDMMMMM